MRTETITVEIPEQYLLQIAVAGNMGDGQLLKLMQVWAEKECVCHGLKQNMLNLMDKRLDEMRGRLENIIGNDVMTDIDIAITNIMEKLRE
ncbi:MAG: hypothetical protein H8D67_22945 [Deltaproteobacteria bacterium]|nr:hypothetical protein [Deltaproteobacteria bacterium]